jgi:hypothetical protein
MTNGESLSWRSIASAPRDQNILVYSLRWGVIVASFDSEFGVWLPRMQCPAVLNKDDTALMTHWMPMPAVPHELTRARSPWHSLAA